MILNLRTTSRVSVYGPSASELADIRNSKYVPPETTPWAGLSSPNFEPVQLVPRLEQERVPSPNSSMYFATAPNAV